MQKPEALCILHKIHAADVNGDGAVTPKDATLIQIYYNCADILEEPKTWEEIIGRMTA